MSKEVADQALRTLAGRPLVTGRDNPADGFEENELSDTERTESARLMRVDHAGEVAAQALYQVQALTARLQDVRKRMEQASQEENDHQGRISWFGRKRYAYDFHGMDYGLRSFVGWPFVCFQNN